MRRALVIGIAVLLGATACSSTAESSDPAGGQASTTTAVTPSAEFPGTEWARVDAASAGLDEAQLDDLEQYLGSSESDCMVVTKNGRLVHEAYWNDFTPTSQKEIFSATKSITSTLVGIAQAEGKLAIDDPASKYITEWQGTPSESVTVRDLLANASGRYWNFNTDYTEMAVQAPDKTAFAIGLSQQFPPGTEWEYNNSAIQTLEAVLERSTGEDTGDYARTRLFEPIGMNSTIRRDPAGNTLAFMGAQASCQDLARFGHLLLQQGRWGAEQIVPAEWVAEATSPATDLNAAYGYLIWLNRPGRIRIPVVGEREGPLWPNAPADAFAALGLGGQTVLVIPSEGIVVTRIGTWTGGVQAQGNLVDEIAKRVVG